MESEKEILNSVLQTNETEEVMLPQRSLQNETVTPTQPSVPTKPQLPRTSENETFVESNDLLVSLYEENPQMNSSTLFWEKISGMSVQTHKVMMDTLFPLITDHSDEYNENYEYRQIYYHWNVNGLSYKLHKRYNDFPDESYYWVYPRGQEPKEKHILFGTFYIQHEIWKHQFPATCEDKKFLLMPFDRSGYGSIIHTYTQVLQLGLDHDRIVVITPDDGADFVDRSFCTTKSMACYFDQLTNCTVSDDIIYEARHVNINSIRNDMGHTNTNTRIKAFRDAKYLYVDFRVGLLTNTRDNVPRLIRSFLRDQSFTKSMALAYWRTQGATFLNRFNKRTLEWITKFNKNVCPSCQNEYDISLYIRHGDKYKEMKLVENQVYYNATKILVDVLGYDTKKKRTIYVNGDEEQSIRIFSSFPSKIVSMSNIQRNKKTFQDVRRAKNIAIITLADLYNQVRADHCVGTYGSNWNRLIYELKMTVGMKSDGYILEVGQDECFSFAHCKLTKKRFENYW